MTCAIYGIPIYDACFLWGCNIWRVLFMGFQYMTRAIYGGSNI